MPSPSQLPRRTAVERREGALETIPLNLDLEPGHRRLRLAGSGPRFDPAEGPCDAKNG
jgi:hypothetical protein